MKLKTSRKHKFSKSVSITQPVTVTENREFEEIVESEIEITNEILLEALEEWFARPEFNNQKDFTKTEIGRFLREKLRSLRRWRELPRNKGDSKNLGQFLNS